MAILSPLAVRFLTPHLIIKGVSTVLQVDIEREGSAVSLESAKTLTVYKADGSSPAGSPYTASLSGTTLSATIPPSDTSSLTVSGKWMVKWGFEVSSDRVYSPTNAAALCVTDLQCPVGVTDLTDRHSQMSTLLAGAAGVQTKITQAWGELLSRMYADETPFWSLRTSGALRPWLIERSKQLCFEDMATAHPSGAIYQTQADRAGDKLEGLYNSLKVRMDDDQNNTLTARSVPVFDPRNVS